MAKPAWMVKGSAAAKSRMKKLRGMVGKGGGKSKPKKKSNPTSPSTNSSTNKMTVGKMLDMGAFLMPAAHKAAQFQVDGDARALGRRLISQYSSYNIDTGQIQPKALIHGYGGALNRGLEKQLFQFLHIKGPPSQVKNFGHVLDLTTYFGATAFDVYENRGDPQEAIRQANLTMYGTDLGFGFDSLQSYNPLPMLTKKLLPYVGQKMLRKGLRMLNIKMPSFNMGG